MQDEAIPPPDSIGWSAARLARQVELALAPLELSPAQYRTLIQLAQGEEASSSLAKKLAVSAPSVTTVVEGLVQRGAVERSHCLEDRRRVSLALTAAGRSLLVAAESAVRDRLEAIAGELPTPGLAARALASLELWGEALDAHRAKRLAAKTEAAAGR